MEAVARVGAYFSRINGPVASIFFTRFRAQKLRDRGTVQWAGARSEARLLHVADNSLIRSDETKRLKCYLLITPTVANLLYNLCW